MEKYIFIIISLIFFFGVLTSTGVSRLIWVFTGIIFLEDRILLLESPTRINPQRLLIYTLFLCELVNPNKLITYFKSFPLKVPMIILLFGLFCIGVFDSRHSAFLNLYRLIDDFIQTFLMVFLCYINIHKIEDWEKVLKSLFISSLILSLYGFYNFITKSNPLDKLIADSFNSESYINVYALFDGRFRVNSFVSHPIYYGYLAGILFLVTFYSFFFKKEYKKICFFLMPIIFLNVILSNSRTSLLATFIGLLAFMLIAFNKIETIKVLFICCLLFLIGYNLPFVKEKIDNTIDLFITGGEKTVGSSVPMRIIQFNASYYEFLKKPVFGNGFLYISETLGASDISENVTSDEEFGGFESYIFHLIIEEGVVGILINIIFFISLLRFFLKKVVISKELAGLGFALTIMFLTFIIGTGALGAWPITMGLIGIIMKLVTLESLQPNYSS